MKSVNLGQHRTCMRNKKNNPTDTRQPGYSGNLNKTIDEKSY